ncbi:Hemin transport system permease protein HmuU [Pseudoalteromonas holothuriae]|uniref:Hemin transport system permease protein HmuU n=1 Tax=Pseudoalteromonas holothuriae TaxID=2963714 RepID=A0A9W4QRI4_9GAMM|nr:MULTISPECIES: iron ABC transporter permease [unclassified Pseudoalteromonas]CAH9049835.1 Hemin transport system permease protein HmuU [Pseudoalteromonas sp. CIP111854]CAH9051859.1 Hemin transport system permease protein HmuU [Pseudoalteromonas sp. CIP111951]
MSRLALLCTFVLLTLVSFIGALSLGAISIDLLDVWQALLSYDSRHLEQKVIVELRLPRTILAFLAGCGLAMAGLILQTVTRNPLADPYLFGISSGASLGVVVLFTLTGVQAGLALSGAAFIGSLLAMTALIVITRTQMSNQVESLVLAGVALSFLFSACTSLLLYWSDPQAISAIVFWTLGSFSRADWQTLWLPALVVSLCIACMLLFRRTLNALLLGDENATTLGVHVTKLRLGMLLLSSLLTAVLVAICGGVGFVGLMVPHIVRFFISQASTAGLLATAFCGGLFMIWVDVIARSVLDNQELPVGVITAAVGSVFFLLLLVLRKRSSPSM